MLEVKITAMKKRVQPIITSDYSLPGNILRMFLKNHLLLLPLAISSSPESYLILSNHHYNLRLRIILSSSSASTHLLLHSFVSNLIYTLFRLFFSLIKSILRIFNMSSQFIVST